jgi:hypothetical protein
MSAFAPRKHRPFAERKATMALLRSERRLWPFCGAKGDYGPFAERKATMALSRSERRLCHFCGAKGDYGPFAERKATMIPFYWLKPPTPRVLYEVIDRK